MTDKSIAAKALPHLAWAAIAVATYFIGASRNKPTATGQPSILANDSTQSEPRASKIDARPVGAAPVITALPSKSGDPLIEDYDNLYGYAVAIEDDLDESPDPLALIEGMSIDERREAAHAISLLAIDAQDPLMGRLAVESKFFGIPSSSLESMLTLSYASKQLQAPDPALRASTAERLGLSDGALDAVEEQLQFNLAQRSRRNAQNLVSVYSAAVAAGADFTGARSKEETARMLTEGVYGSAESGFDTTQFRVPTLDAEQLREALEHVNSDFNFNDQ